MPFNPLDCPEIFSEPVWLQDPGGWVEHIPFAFLIMRLAAPARFVELGTHSGNSYCALCQGAQLARLQTRGAAVDTWKGDRHSLEYPESVYLQLRSFHDRQFGSFSELLRMTFDEGVSRFEDHSIDLLHIDGLHTYDAVKHDFESWLPKMSPRGTVIFHDSAVTTGDFGVHRLTAELKPRYPHFEFMHGHGLTILAVGSQPPPGLLAFFQDAGAQPDQVRGLFHALGRSIFHVFLLRRNAAQINQVREAVMQWERTMGIPVGPVDPNPMAAADPGLALMNLWRQLQAFQQGIQGQRPPGAGPNMSVGMKR